MDGDRILVAYASRNDATHGVAEAIGKTLAESGVAVDVLPVAEVADLSPYRAVVVGSAIQGGQWLPEAMQFLKKHQAELAGMPFAAFQVCMTVAMKEGAYREHAATWMEPVRQLVWPLSEGLFAGKFDIHNRMPSELVRLKFRIAILLKFWPTGDHRNWQAVRIWAENLRTLLLR